MKRSVLLFLTILLMAGLDFAVTGEVEDNTSPKIGITDKSIEARKMDVIGFEPADRGPRMEGVESRRLFTQGMLPSDAGGYLSSKLPDDGLTEKGKEAVDIAPDWLRVALADLFKRLENESKQDNWAQLIIDHATEKYIDELVFTIAHSSAWYMKQPFANYDAYLENVQMLYVIDADLSYLDIVDYGEPGVDDDYYSTIRYWTLNEEGEKVQREYDRDLYYWYVVHPKLSEEGPDIGASGKFWREYLYYDVEGKQSYSTFACLKNPNTITEDDVNGWGYSSHGYFEGKSGWIIPKIADKETGEGVLISYPMSNGCVLATMMPVDKVENEGQRKLLENLVFNGNGEITIEQMLPNPNAKIRFAIFKDKDPWGTPAVENAIKKFGNQYEVYTSADMATFELHPQCKKIIIPSDQPRSFYEALSANRDRFSEWTKNYNVFQFHGASSPENDWSDLEMPCGLRSVSQVENMSDTLELRKYPILRVVLPLAEVVWDSKVQSLPTGRPFEEGNTAIDILSNWAGYNLNFNAHPPSRPNQPEQIAFEHDGNCGEIQDLIAAAGRVALVPMSCTDGFVEDHVWNEFYDEGWFFLNNGWYGGNTSIAKEGGGQDKDYGGGKNISVIRRNRGDGFNENITENYSKNCTLEVHVYDKNGYPVDGANVQIYTEWYYDENTYVKPIEYSTDSNGFASFVLGDNRNYYIRVESPIGNYPEDKNDLIQVIETSEPDMLYTWECNLDGGIVRLDTVKVDHDPRVSLLSLVALFQVDSEWIYGQTSGKGYCEPSDTGKIDYFICDAENLAKYLDGEQFSVFEFGEDIQEASPSIYVREGERLYLVLSNDKRLRNAQLGSVSVQYRDEEGMSIMDLDEIETDFRIHPGERLIVGLNNKPPFVLAAGFFDTFISESEGGELKFRALLMDPDGYDDISHVELVIDGKKTGDYFRDDGEKADEKAGDSLFSLKKMIFAGAMEAGIYKNYGVVAVDNMGLESTVWPKLHIESEASSLELIDPMRYPGVPESELVAFMNFHANLNQYSGEPLILAGGYGSTVLNAESGGLLNLYAVLSGGGSMDVEIFYNGGPLGIFLNDSGMNGDLIRGDGVYTFSWNFNSFPEGDYIFELQATDGEGNKSVLFPYFEVEL